MNAAPAVISFENVSKSYGAAAPVLEVRNLKKHFPVKKGVLRRTVGGRRRARSHRPSHAEGGSRDAGTT